MKEKSCQREFNVVISKEMRFIQLIDIWMGERK